MRVHTSLALFAVLLLAAPARAGIKKIERISVSSSGIPGNAPSGGVEPPAISADGRFVAFVSSASNLVAGDTNGFDDVFVRDRVEGTTERVSIATGGAQGNQASGTQFFHAGPSISDDGRFVAFTSYAGNLVPGDGNNQGDVFVRDRQFGTTELISRSSAGVVGNDRSWVAAISGDGRFVAFRSSASNLVAGDTNGAIDIFVRDRQTGTTERVSVASGGGQGNADSQGNLSISGDGRFVAFESFASNLAPGDNNGLLDVFVRDRTLGTTERVSVATNGTPGNDHSFSSSMTPDGRFVVFDSVATNLAPGDTNGHADVFVRDRRTSITERVSLTAGNEQGSHDSGRAWLSGDGRFVIFLTLATNLVTPDANGEAEDVLVKDRATGTLERFNTTLNGTQGNAGSVGVAVSADGYHIAFVAAASNLVVGDTNDGFDVFAAERTEAATPYRIAVFRPSTREWFLRAADGSASVVQWGGPEDVPVPANYLGDGRTDEVAVFRPATREWFVRVPGGSKGSDTLAIQFGGPEDVPVPADYLATGQVQVAVFRPATREWFIRTDAGGTAGPIQFGEPGDIPIHADYLGLGRAQFAVFRPASADWFLRADNGATTPIQFGDPGDIPVPGDYYGLGHAQIAVYRPSSGEWFVRGPTGFTARYFWGGPGDQPLPGDYAAGFGGGG